MDHAYEHHEDEHKQGMNMDELHEFPLPCGCLLWNVTSPVSPDLSLHLSSPPVSTSERQDWHWQLRRELVAPEERRGLRARQVL